MTRLLLFVMLAGCSGSSSLKKVGESCTASSECESGLLCDSATMKCASKGTVDAAIDAGPDALIDAAIDAKIDAQMIDAAVDADIDAEIDAM